VNCAGIASSSRRRGFATSPHGSPRSEARPGGLEAEEAPGLHHVEVLRLLDRGLHLLAVFVSKRLRYGSRRDDRHRFTEMEDGDGVLITFDPLEHGSCIGDGSLKSNLNTVCHEVIVRQVRAPS